MIKKAKKLRDRTDSSRNDEVRKDTPCLKGGIIETLMKHIPRLQKMLYLSESSVNFDDLADFLCVNENISKKNNLAILLERIDHYEKKLSEKLKENLEKVDMEYLDNGSSENHYEDLLELAHLFEFGYGVEKNVQISIELYEELAYCNCYEAIGNLVEVYNGRDNHRDLFKCLKFALQKVKKRPGTLPEFYSMVDSDWVKELFKGENDQKKILQYCFDIISYSSKEGNLGFHNDGGYDELCAILHVFEIAANQVSFEPEFVEKILENSLQALNIDDFEGFKQQVIDAVLKVNLACAKRSSRLLVEATRIEEREKAVAEMFSYFTHTVHNALGNAPKGLSNAMKVFKEAGFAGGNEELTAINIIAEVSSTISFLESLISNFKLLIADPSAFRFAWEKDSRGDGTVEMALALALRQSLARVIFSANSIGQFKFLVGSGDEFVLKNAQQSFLDNVMALELNSNNAFRIIDWVKTWLPNIRIEFEDCKKIQFSPRSVKYATLFAVMAELMSNAMKFSSREKPIDLFWALRGGCWKLQVSNSCGEIDPRMLWSRNGLKFIKRLVGLLAGGSLDFINEPGYFRVELGLEESVLAPGEVI